MNRLTKLSAAVVLALAAPLGIAVQNPKTPPEVLKQYAEGYVSGDLGQLANTFAGEADHNGDNVEDAFFGYHRMFRETRGREVQFHDVRVNGRKVTAWVYVKGRVECGGPIDIEMTHSGYIRKFMFDCLADPDAIKRKNAAVSGQMADITTTGIGLASGFAEANPLLAGIGFPATVALKLGVDAYAETLPEPDCHAVKNGLDATGWGFAGWNFCTMASGGFGGIPCALLGLFAGKTAHEENRISNLMICRQEMPGERYVLIDNTGIYVELTEVATRTD